MPVTVSPTQEEVEIALRDFLVSILPAGTPVLLGQVNRVPEPAGTNFVVFWPLRFPRLATNIDTFSDAVFTASIAGTLMSVSSIEVGTVEPGRQVFGTGLSTGTGGTTTIVSQVSGSAGGTGAYTVSPSQSVPSQRLAAGAATFLQKGEAVYQVDVHGPDSGNSARVISTMFRDPYAVSRFASTGYDVVPLFADDPRQLPFTNEGQQYEDRWVIEANMQVNATVSGIAQQFADAVEVDLVEVDAAFPA